VVREGRLQPTPATVQVKAAADERAQPLEYLNCNSERKIMEESKEKESDGQLTKLNRFGSHQQLQTISSSHSQFLIRTSLKKL